MLLLYPVGYKGLAVQWLVALKRTSRRTPFKLVLVQKKRFAWNEYTPKRAAQHLKHNLWTRYLTLIRGGHCSRAGVLLEYVLPGGGSPSLCLPSEHTVVTFHLHHSPYNNAIQRRKMALRIFTASALGAATASPLPVHRRGRVRSRVPRYPGVGRDRRGEAVGGRYQSTTQRDGADG